ncbi:hypothetical protein LINPERHAP1_LOCUS6891, partial [Linum perenne]
LFSCCQTSFFLSPQHLYKCGEISMMISSSASTTILRQKQ